MSAATIPPSAALPPAVQSPKAEAAQKPLKKAAITGVSVLLEMTSGGLFMENVKMEKQRTSAPYPQIARNVLSQGIRGFEAGLWPWGVVLGLSKGTVLGGAKANLDAGLKSLGVDKKKSDLIAGFGAGAVQGVFMSPILLARTRVNQAISERVASGGKSLTVAQEMKLSQSILASGIESEGLVKTLTQGMMTCVFKRALDWGTRFIFINGFRNFLIEKSPDGTLTDAQKLYTSFAGGAASVTVTMPIDRLMPIIQSAGGGGQSISEVLKAKFAKEGITTLQRGWALRTLHTGYHTMFAIFVADKVYSLLS
ncbi:hypothetical protein SARC_13526 [Sphaeroforma arctica JP610]|uniref:Uncharacterized protein n=1 Tax=Sphaeroforma arctica JP610 TaxID=667725 RepID=A0A0L0FAX7_9EUKA|nr:hypothetical protein SARC_13526 [Sphaeroforma arctica JP610]KNC73915.1 hypothetical protein SARC_13526 [Sphaeroforma arctica JP610]|eukprot:XP_014147817.1 hypothetical protein SARC_13526 [Sphaeroforma arctica JP610]